MLIRAYKAMKTNHNDQLRVQHTTNAKYTKYLHLGINILLGHECEVLNTFYQHLKSTKKMLQYIEINTNTEYKTKIENKTLSLNSNNNKPAIIKS